jgi:hypothetical protein
MEDPYLLAHLRRLCAEDEEITELGIELLEEDNTIVLRGQVTSEVRRDRIVQRVTAALPEHPVRNEIVVASVGAPEAAEEIA